MVDKQTHSFGIRQPLRWLLITLAGSLAGCNWSVDTTTTQVAGKYYLTTDYEGYGVIHYGNPWFRQPRALAQSVDSIGTTKQYLVVCHGDEATAYSLLPLTVESEQQARAGVLGTLSRTACRRKLYQLTGDSTLQLSHTL